jgi:hypothetical protein
VVEKGPDLAASYNKTDDSSEHKAMQVAAAAAKDTSPPDAASAMALATVIAWPVLVAEEMAWAILVESEFLRPSHKDLATATDSATADPPLEEAEADADAKEPQTPPLWRSWRAADQQIRAAAGQAHSCLRLHAGCLIRYTYPWGAEARVSTKHIIRECCCLFGIARKAIACGMLCRKGIGVDRSLRRHLVESTHLAPS